MSLTVTVSYLSAFNKPRVDEPATELVKNFLNTLVPSYDFSDSIVSSNPFNRIFQDIVKNVSARTSYDSMVTSLSGNPFLSFHTDYFVETVFPAVRKLAEETVISDLSIDFISSDDKTVKNLYMDSAKHFKAGNKGYSLSYKNINSVWKY